MDTQGTALQRLFQQSANRRPQAARAPSRHKTSAIYFKGYERLPCVKGPHKYVPELFYSMGFT